MRNLTVSARLVLLILVAATPVFLLHIWSALSERETVRTAAEDQLVRSTRLLAAQQLQFFTSARDMLAAALLVTGEISPDDPSCPGLLALLVEGNGSFEGIAIAGRDGTILCSSNPGEVGVTVTDQASFMEALTTGALAVGAPTADMIPVAYAIRSGGAEPERVAVGRLSLQSLTETMALPRLPLDAVGVIFNADRGIVARGPAGTAFNENTFAPVTPELAQSRGGVGIIESPTEGGLRHIWAIADLLPEQGLFVAVGMETALLFAAAEADLWQGLGLLAAVFIAAGVGAWALGHLAIKQPLERLGDAMTARRTGDYSARPIPLSSAKELRSLEESFDAMSDALQSRENELRARNERLDQLIGEKEMLVKEMNHRIKNSLQLVSSVIGLQLEELKDPEAVARLQDARARVAAIAKVHERLYSGARLDSVEVGPYLEDVCTDLARTMSLREGDLVFRMAVGERTLPTDTVVPLAMIVCELITNAIKHTSGMRRSIRVDLDDTGGRFNLTVADNGPGLPDGSSPMTGLGLRVAGALAHQIGAELKLEPTADGTTARITFTA